MPFRVSRRRIDLDGVNVSRNCNGLYFSTRGDYEQHLQKLAPAAPQGACWKDDDVAAAVQRHWHTRGQNGCVFAQIAATDAGSIGWQTVVLRLDDHRSLPEQLHRLSTIISEAVQDPDCNLLSLLFPEPTTAAELVPVLATLLSLNEIVVAKVSTEGGLASVALRIPLDEERVLSWLMAFGPIDTFPVTRQGPQFEVVIRTKVKPPEIFHRLTQDRDAAHLADVPLKLSEEQKEGLWTATLARTRRILSGEPNAYSAAKVTFTIEESAWRRAHAEAMHSKADVKPLEDARALLPSLQMT
jgi:hypothetical protein